jgi:hypothetical protein
MGCVLGSKGVLEYWSIATATHYFSAPLLQNQGKNILIGTA